MNDILKQELRLPCGVVISNRLAKAATTEGLSDACNRATDRHQNLYKIWSQSGAGLLITGNVQVDRRYMERPGNVAIDNNGGHGMLCRWAEAGRAGGNELWMQISHAGRQTPKHVNPCPVGPSAIGVAGKSEGYCNTPRALRSEEIEEIIRRFTHVAVIARDCGFTGVQIHSAHGYLLSSFLSPLANRRDDKWGGSLSNRARLLLEVVCSVRNAVGPDFPVSVKLNSADFQQGGFSLDECCHVVEWLNAEGLDLLEVSGGNYENPKMMQTLTAEGKETTLRNLREAYFLEYAAELRRVARFPLMVTGGFRSRSVMEVALAEDTLDLIGMARPFVTQPDFPGRLLSGEADAPAEYDDHSLFWFYLQLLRLGDGLEPDLNIDDRYASSQCMVHEMRAATELQERSSGDL